MNGELVLRNFFDKGPTLRRKNPRRPSLDFWNRHWSRWPTKSGAKFRSQFRRSQDGLISPYCLLLLPPLIIDGLMNSLWIYMSLKWGAKFKRQCLRATASNASKSFNEQFEWKFQFQVAHNSINAVDWPMHHQVFRSHGQTTGHTTHLLHRKHRYPLELKLKWLFSINFLWLFYQLFIIYLLIINSGFVARYVAYFSGNWLYFLWTHYTRLSSINFLSTFYQ